MCALPTARYAPCPRTGGRISRAVAYEFSEPAFHIIRRSFSARRAILELRELWTLVSVLKLVLLNKSPRGAQLLMKNPTNRIVRHWGLRSKSARHRGDHLEGRDRATDYLRSCAASGSGGAYARMDFESRDFYRKKSGKYRRTLRLHRDGSCARRLLRWHARPRTVHIPTRAWLCASRTSAITWSTKELRCCSQRSVTGARGRKTHAGIPAAASR